MRCCRTPVFHFQSKFDRRGDDCPTDRNLVRPVVPVTVGQDVPGPRCVTETISESGAYRVCPGRTLNCPGKAQDEIGVVSPWVVSWRRSFPVDQANPSPVPQHVSSRNITMLPAR